MVWKVCDPRGYGRLAMEDGQVTSGFHHVPVMGAEVVACFDGLAPGIVIDATVGGGGHASELLEAYPHLRVVGLDRDRSAIDAATARLARFGERATVVHARFDELAAVLDELGIRSAPTAGPGRDAPGIVVGALFDLGVSSPQLDRAERGFSIRFDAPLDMRMDQDQPTTAASLLNSLDESALVALLRDYGDEPHARRIARAIVAHRPLHTTGQLADTVSGAVPAAGRRRGHPATRTFQALRIAVNAELDVLPVALDAAIAHLAPGGRLAVLAYHSGEDRIVKERLRAAATGGCTCPPRLGCVCGATPTMRLVWRGAHKPSEAELANNPRASSARLRCAEKLATNNAEAR